jgi:hypothetical protein
MLKGYKDVVFYIAPKDEHYSYDRYFVEYTLPEGLRLFSDFGYSGSITNGGFYRLDKNEVTADGLTHGDLLKIVEGGDLESAKQLLTELNATNTYSIKYGQFYDEATKTMVCIGTSKQARAWMTERSVKHGLTFSKG